MIPIAIIANLVAYSIVVSQPLAYMFFMSKAQRALSAPAYIELRQRINPVMNRRVPVIYSIAIATLLALIAASLHSRSWSVTAAAVIAFVSLLLDIALMTRENLPLNGAVDRWSLTEYPDDWEDYRTRWFAVFAYRQAVLLVGFFSLVIGAVFR